jgi:MauM/NapG family ferredoxin protein
LLFVASFFIAISFPLAYALDSRWFLRANPLVGFLTFIASRKIIVGFALATLLTTVATVLFGRVFCGFFCPLGAAIDFVDHFIFKTLRQPQRRPQHYLQRLKYFFLAVIVLVSLSGVFFPLFTDPLSLITRIFTVFVYPLPSLIEELLKPLVGFLGLNSTRLSIPLFYGSTGIGILFLLIFAGAYWDRRFWCQYICPSGAFFGLLSRYALLRRKISTTKCGGCSLCVKKCPTRAINHDDHRKTSVAECILCGECVGVKKDCSLFTMKKSADFTGKTVGADIGRRQVILGVAAGALLLPLLKANAMGKRDNTGRLVRPPGAVPEDLFSARCLACGQCMKVCPTNAIQPCTLDDGLQRLSTPKIVPRIGACEEKCHACGNVCPTEALRKLPYEEKRFAKIGTAVIDKNRCLAWEQNKECLVCDEVCPYHAIDPKVLQTSRGMFKVPVVDADLCMGCGMCEQRCPIFDTAAIVVYKFGENRRLKGPYMSEAQKQMVTEKRKRTDAISIGPGAGGQSPAEQPTQNDTSTSKEQGAAPSTGFSF